MPYEYMVWACAFVFLVLAAWDAGYLHRGRHRGVYEEKPEWRPPEPEFIAWEGAIKFPEAGPPNSAVFILTPLENHGRFGDLDIDRADTAPLCPFLPDGCLGDIGEEWVEIGVLD